MESLFNILIAICGFGFVAWLGRKIIKGSLKRTEEPAALILKWIITGGLLGVWAVTLGKFLKAGGPGLAFMVPITAVIFLILGILWAPTMAKTLFKPLTNVFDGGDEEADPTPFYAIAEAKRKRGLYDASIAEVRAQLEKFPHDMQGHLMLAELLAEHKDDVDGATELLEYFISECQPGQINGSFVLNRLADFHLKYNKDPEKARKCLQRIQWEYPESEQADKAAQRIAHLQDEDFLKTRHQPKKFEVRKLDVKLGLSDDTQQPQPPAENMDAKAHEMVAHLEQHPSDTDVREQLAWLYAEHYGKIDWAIDQLKQLTQMEHQSVSKLARWYNQMADVYCRFSGSAEAARISLEEFIERFPDSGHADRMRTRLKRLNLEARTSRKGQSMETGPFLQS